MTDKEFWADAYLKAYDKFLDKLEYKDIDDIGFTYNVIDEIKSRFCFETKNQYDIEQVAKIVNITNSVRKTYLAFTIKSVTFLIFTPPFV